MGEPQRGAVRAGDDLHVHPVPLVPLPVVRLIRGDPVGRDEGSVNGDEVAFTQTHQGLSQARGPGGETLEVSSTYRQAVATETPKTAATCANVSFFRRRASASRACLKQPSHRYLDGSA